MEAALISVVGAGFVALITTLAYLLVETRKEFAAKFDSVDAKFDGLRSHMDAKFDGLRSHMDGEFKALRAEIGGLRETVATHGERLARLEQAPTTA